MNAITEVNNATILPLQNNDVFGKGGVLNAEGIYIQASGKSDHYIKYGGTYPYDELSVVYYYSEVVWFGLFYKHWGHFIIELINRMWFIKENPSAFMIAYISTKNVKLSGVYLEFLQLLGIKEHQLIKIDKPTQFKKVIIPNYCASETFLSESYKDLINKVINNSLLHKPQNKYAKKIYFSRTQLSSFNKKEFGEIQIENFYKKKGFQILFPEKMSLIDQIYVWNHSDEIACLNSTIPLNLIFSHSKPKLYILNKTHFKHENLIRISDYFDYPIHYIDVRYSKFDNLAKNIGIGPFFVYVTNNLKSTYSPIENTKKKIFNLDLFRLHYYKLKYLYHAYSNRLIEIIKVD